MGSSAATRVKQTRLAPQVRRDQLIDAARDLALAQGYLPAPAERLAAAAGVSKALVYAYFPSQHDLFNAVLTRQMDRLAEAGLEAASEKPGLKAAALACARLYFDQVAREGPIIHVILRDQFMAGHVDRAVTALRDRVILRLALRARRELRLGARENIAAISMITTIPEEAGRLAHAGEMQADRAWDLCADLVSAAIAALGPAA